MSKLFPLLIVVVVAAIGTPLHAGIFDQPVNDTAAESAPLHGGGDAIAPLASEAYVPAPSMDQGYSSYGYSSYGPSSYGPAQVGYGYPFKSGCCESHHGGAAGLWRGFSHRSHGGCGHGCKGGYGCKGGCKSGCGTGHCGHGIGFGKGFGHVQQKGHVQHMGHVQHKGHVQHSRFHRSHVQRGYGFGGHAQHGKGHVGCSTCGQTPCGCHSKGHHQKGFGFHGKHLGHGFGKGHLSGDCGCGPAVHGKGLKPHCGLGLFKGRHHCDTCGKSAGFGFGKGGCDCGGSNVPKGYSNGGNTMWDQSHSLEAPQLDYPTPANEPTIAPEVQAPAESLPIPTTPTGHSARLRRLPPVGSQY